MLLRTAMGSFLFHFCSSSCILSILAGLRAHRQPLREELPDLFSTFSKHLLRDRLWRTEFFQPSGAVCQTRARQEFRLGSGSKSWLRVWAPEKLHFVCRTTDHSGAFPSQHPAHARVPFRGGVGRTGNLTVSYFHLKSAFVLLCPWLTLQRQAEVVHKGRAGGCYRVLGFSPTWSGTTLHRFSGLCLEPFVEKEITIHKSLVPTLERE